MFANILVCKTRILCDFQFLSLASNSNRLWARQEAALEVRSLLQGVGPAELVLPPLQCEATGCKRDVKWHKTDELLTWWGVSSRQGKGGTFGRGQTDLLPHAAARATKGPSLGKQRPGATFKVSERRTAGAQHPHYGQAWRDEGPSAGRAGQRRTGGRRSRRGRSRGGLTASYRARARCSRAGVSPAACGGRRLPHDRPGEGQGRPQLPGRAERPCPTEQAGRCASPQPAQGRPELRLGTAVRDFLIKTCSLRSKPTATCRTATSKFTSSNR